MAMAAMERLGGLLVVLLACHASPAGPAAAAATAAASAEHQGCACPRGDEDLAPWLACLGLDAAERARLAAEAWTADDVRLMSVDEAEAALRVRRALAWRITRYYRPPPGRRSAPPPCARRRGGRA